MFDAIAAKKARLDVIIEGKGKQPREDLITSQLFGTVRFLSSSAQKLALETLVGAKLEGDATIHLWPKFGRIEPDVVLELTRGIDTRYWIVEVKWGADFSGEDQALREIDAVMRAACYREGLRGQPRDVVGYTLLGAERKHEDQMASLVVTFGGDLTIRSRRWPEVTTALRQLEADQDGGLAAWARCAANFLSRTRMGAALDNWPEMTMPESCSYRYDTSRRFGWGGFFRPVPACEFHFHTN
jgi:hypothetical protein